MAYLNANIPMIYSQIKREYLYDLKEHYGEVEDCIIFGLASITGRPILFHAIMEKIVQQAKKLWTLAITNKKVTIGVVIAIIIIYELATK